MKKEIIVEGSKRTLRGYVNITTEKRVKEGTNAITHDDYTKVIPVYKFQTFVEGNLLDTYESVDMHELLNVLPIYEEKLENRLRDLSEMSENESFEDILSKLGYK